MSSAENGKPAGRLVWMGDDDTITLEWLVWFFRQPTGAVDDTQEWAQSMLDRMEAAPADPAEAIERGILGTFPDLIGVRISLSMDHSERAATACARRVLAALGVPDASQRRSGGDA